MKLKSNKMNLFEKWTDKEGNTTYIRELSAEHIANILRGLKKGTCHCSVSQFETLIYECDKRHILDYERKIFKAEDVIELYEEVDDKEFTDNEIYKEQIK